jgi:hypothetical protein
MNDIRPNNLTEIPLEHYSELFKNANPNELSERSGIQFENGSFRLSFLGRDIKLTYPDMKAYYIESGEEAAPKLAILIGRFLLSGEISRWSGKFLSYQEMPWGNVYFTQFKGRCLMRLAFGFGNNIERFKRACESLKGVKAPGGDAAYDIEFIIGLTMRLIIWEGDEEFPPSAQILFSDNFPNAFSAEDMAVCGDLIIDAMKNTQ